MVVFQGENTGGADVTSCQYAFHKVGFAFGFDLPNKISEAVTFLFVVSESLRGDACKGAEANLVDWKGGFDFKNDTRFLQYDFTGVLCAFFLVRCEVLLEIGRFFVF